MAYIFDISPEKEASKLDFLRRQFFGAPPAISHHDVDLRGKSAIVTGANGGIGLECCRQLLDLGLSKLILAVRDEAKGEAACKTLKLVDDQTIEVWKLDYASYESVTDFAQRVEHLNSRIDIAILNAGVNRGYFALNPNTGHEEDVQTNYLSTVLLALLLLRGFRNDQSTTSSSTAGTSSRRIVIVSSDTAAWAKFDEKGSDPLLPAFDVEASWDKIDRYGTTKLLGQLFVTELAKRVPASLAIVNCANPGLCYGSSLPRELGWVIGAFTRVIGRSVPVGARSLLHAAIRLDESSHGHYIEDGQIRPMAPFVYSEEAGQTSQRLWKETMDEFSSAGFQDIL